VNAFKPTVDAVVATVTPSVVVAKTTFAVACSSVTTAFVS